MNLSEEQKQRLVDAAVSMMEAIAALASQAALAVAQELNPLKPPTQN